MCDLFVVANNRAGHFCQAYFRHIGNELHQVHDIASVDIASKEGSLIMDMLIVG